MLRRRLDPLLEALKSLRNSHAENDVRHTLTQALESIDLPVWSLLLGTKDQEATFGESEFEMWCSGDGEWRRRYTQNNWILVDPFIQHMQYSNLPMTFPYDVTGESGGQERFLEVFHANGFAYGVATPLHLAQARLALLYAGRPSHISREDLLDKLPFVTALGQEAAIGIEVQREDRKRNLLSPLTESELEFLVLVRKGFSTSEIASLTSTTPAQTNNVFRRINEKLGTRSRTIAAELAEKLGFYRLSMLSKVVKLHPERNMPNDIE